MRAWILLAFSLGLVACVNLPAALEQELQCPPAASPNHFSEGGTCGALKAVRTQGLPVANGQVIVNEHPGAKSLLLSLVATRFSSYIHIGIIAIEDGEPQVYEAYGNFIPMPWGGRHYMGSGVRRVTLESFLARGGIVAIHEPPAQVDRMALLAFARDALRRRVPFDGDYNPRDPSKYFCVEFVARALAAAGGESVDVVPISRNPSLRVALDWFGVGGQELLLAGDVVADMRRVVLVSPGYSVADVERYFALKRELHRRFTDDQKLGSLFFLDGHDLKLRPALEQFTDEAMRSTEEPDVLADRYFGPLQEGGRLAGSPAARD